MSTPLEHREPDLLLSLPARAENVAVVRHAFGGLGDVLELPEQTLSDIKLAVTEACTNVVVHAYPDRDDGPLGVQATLDERTLTIVVTDEGRGVLPRADSPGLGPRPAPDRDAGRVARAGHGRQPPDRGAHDLRPRRGRRPRRRVLGPLMMAATASATMVKVRSGPLAGAVLGRVVGMLAARAQCPIDRLDDALLVTDAVAAHAPAHSRDQHVLVVVEAQETELELRVQGLRPDGAQAMISDAELPGVGNVFERVADEVRPTATTTATSWCCACASRRDRDDRDQVLTSGFSELTLQVRDLEALERFYRESFGLEVLAREDDRVWLAAGERARLGCGCPARRSSATRAVRHVHFALAATPGRLDGCASAWTDAASATAGRSSTTGAIARSTSRTPRATWSRCGTSSSAARAARRAWTRCLTTPRADCVKLTPRCLRSSRSTRRHLDDQRHVIAVAGEIDLFTAPELKSALGAAVEGGRTRIVVDLTETSFLDSTALGVLIGAVKRLRTRDGVLTIVNTDRNIAKTFEITGLDQIFTIRPTRGEAIEALDADEATA